MSGGADEGTIVIKKVINVAGGHHGGGWKMAYADFVTAMMAFFLLLWLLSVASSEQCQGIADYFAPSAVSISSESGAGGLLAGKSMAEDGARASSSAPPAVTFEITAPKGKQDEDSQDSKQAGDSAPNAEAKDTADTNDDVERPSAESRPPSEAEIQQKLAEQEQVLFEEMRQNIELAIAELENAEEIKRSLIIDNTPEGLRIQITDQDGKSMFPSGSAVMHGHMCRAHWQDRPRRGTDDESHLDHRTYQLGALPWPAGLRQLGTVLGPGQRLAPRPDRAGRFAGTDFLCLRAGRDGAPDRERPGPAGKPPNFHRPAA